MIELRHLRYFVAVAEELHFGRAAERLHMAQPPLSQQIKQLEVELGFTLFHRTKRSVRLSEAGLVFLTETRRLFWQLDQAIEAGRQASRGESGQLIIGFVSSAAYNILPELLRAFRAEAPEVRLELHELPTNEQLDWLRAGKIDLGLLRPPVEDRALHSQIVLREPMVVALPEAHPLMQQAQISWADLASQAFILFPRPLSTQVYDQIISFCQQAGFSPNIVQEAMQMQTIVSLVAGEIGISIVPVSLQNMQRMGVGYRPLAAPVPYAEVAAVWRQNDSATVQRFLKALQLISSPATAPAITSSRIDSPDGLLPNDGPLC